MFRRRKWFVRLFYLWAELEPDRRHHPLAIWLHPQSALQLLDVPAS